MKRAAFVLPLLLVFGIASAVEAGPKVKPVKNQKLSSYAKNRPRGPKGKFDKLPAGDLLVRGSLRGNGRANPSSTGSSPAQIDFTPATRTKSGGLVVRIPQMYVGSEGKPRTVQRQLFARDIHGNDVVIDGTLHIAGGSRGFSQATFRGTIPTGAKLSQRGVEGALRSLQVHQTGLTWKPFDGGE